jgi:hypothetical protein
MLKKIGKEEGQEKGNSSWLNFGPSKHLPVFSCSPFVSALERALKQSLGDSSSFCPGDFSLMKKPLASSCNLFCNVEIGISMV